MSRNISLSEKIKHKKRELSGKYNDWKEYRYNPWKEQNYKPWKKDVSKKIKRGKKDLIKKIRKWKNILIKKYKRWRKNKANKSGLNINIKNIEKIEIGEKKINYNNHLNFFVGNDESKELEFENRNTFPIERDINGKVFPIESDFKQMRFLEDNDLRKIPFNSNTNQLRYLEFNRGNLNQGNVNFNEILTKFDQIQKLLGTTFHKEVIIECQKLIDMFIEKISQLLRIDYRGVDHFLMNLTNMKLDVNFIFYAELVEYSKFLRSSRYRIDQFTAHTLFLITKRIINKLEYTLNNKFSNGYDEIIH